METLWFLLSSSLSRYEGNGEYAGNIREERAWILYYFLNLFPGKCLKTLKIDNLFFRCCKVK